MYLDNYPCNQIIFEFDCLPLLQKLQKANVDRSLLGHLITQLQHRISAHGNVKVQYNPSKCIIPTHLLAKHACEIEDILVWSEEVPHYANLSNLDLS